MIGIGMKLAVIDVGSNTIRLLVACVQGGELEAVEQRTAWVRLGSDVAATGAISPLRLEAAARAVSEFAAEARKLGCMHVETLVASPGRQAENGSDLLRRLEVASHTPVRLLRRDEEARLAYDGAVTAAGVDDHTVAVCDVGGGSTQLAIGTADLGPVWLRSLDVGSLRLTRQVFVQDPPGKQTIKEARRTVREHCDGLVFPLPKTALAVGGSARGLKRLVGTRTLGEDELAAALRMLRKRSSAELAAEHGIDPERARTLAAGAVILSEMQRRLMVPLEVGRGGVREGALLELAAQQTAA
jgi:exopolyphosphatase / guanosine-5'-triphosphate,3'-diphosphate pyrophosphatase